MFSNSMSATIPDSGSREFKLSSWAESAGLRSSNSTNTARGPSALASTPSRAGSAA